MWCNKCSSKIPIKVLSSNNSIRMVPSCQLAYSTLADLVHHVRGELGIKLNNMLTKDSYTIVPLVHRGRVSAHANSLGGVILNTWDSELWNVADWYRID